jgi:hypothetical protein
VLALEDAFAVPKRPSAADVCGAASATARARGAGDGASHAQLQYASTTLSNEAAAKVARNPVLFKTLSAG